jgi:hypothetical protein
MSVDSAFGAMVRDATAVTQQEKGWYRDGTAVTQQEKGWYNIINAITTTTSNSSLSDF